MTKALSTAAMMLLLATSAAFAGDHRPGDAALGALSGAVVFGPVGAVVGYAAGPSIARSWGFDRRGSARHRRQASKDARGARAEVIQSGPAKNPRMAVSRNETGSGALPGAKPPAPAASTTPPVQTLE
jgi:hypothetical protein